MILGESCYNGLVRRKNNLLTPISKYSSPLAILAKGLGLGYDLRLPFGVLGSVSKIPVYYILGSSWLWYVLMGHVSTSTTVQHMLYSASTPFGYSIVHDTQLVQ